MASFFGALFALGDAIERVGCRWVCQRLAGFRGPPLEIKGVHIALPEGSYLASPSSAVLRQGPVNDLQLEIVHGFTSIRCVVVVGVAPKAQGRGGQIKVCFDALLQGLGKGDGKTITEGLDAEDFEGDLARPVNLLQPEGAIAQ